jgi:hypothetical protein
VVRPDSHVTLCKVTKVARLLAAKTYNVMALLDGGMLKRQKSWVKVSNHLLVDFVSMPYAYLTAQTFWFTINMTLLDVALMLF